MQREIAEIERELRLIGRHVAMGAFGTRGRLDRSAYLLLSRIEIEGPMSIGQLAEAFGLDTSTVNRQTAALLRSGVAERIPDPDGGMARKVRITPEGLRRLHADRAWATDGLGVVLAGWTREDLAGFASVLARFNMAVEDHEGRGWPRPGPSGTAGLPATVVPPGRRSEEDFG
ncbi:MarR family winged helix-turn-helix transcriptional regulator [Planotetraspora phitsanulokensis]|uniref:Transcriptional regulator n=1 Tax=Planotetraspora phitsanulokensis TaxID=575192 RepID=A0A8J3XH86_9ACTN|nr:MarR family transcriptional regulator [Planotetraspora phitsanulokensis]GII36303.1 transcriptional regulator [Planotetraspora phitsanulokensis]